MGRGRTLLFVPRALVVALVVLLAGCGGGGNGGDPRSKADAPSDTQAGAGVFVGQLSGFDATIAIVSDGDQVAGHVCDGRLLSFWFAVAPFRGDTAELAARIGFNVGMVTVGDSRARGEFLIEGMTATFDAEATTGGAGLYRAVVGEVGQPGYAEAGWIVRSDGTQCSGLTTYAVEGSVPAPPLSPGVGQIELPGFGTATIEHITEPSQLDLGSP